MSELLTRSFGTELANEGRTLEGLAFQWEHPALVRDRSGPSYLEEFGRGSADKSMKERSFVPLGFLHPWAPGSRTDPTPLGSATFRASAEGLVFAAVLSKTRAADEMLELVNDHAVRDVSVGFRSIRSRPRQSPAGKVLTRTEIALAELSLAPTGLAQHPGAQVLAVRANSDFVADLRRRRAALGAPR